MKLFLASRALVVGWRDVRGRVTVEGGQKGFVATGKATRLGRGRGLKRRSHQAICYI